MNGEFRKTFTYCDRDILRSKISIKRKSCLMVYDADISCVLVYTTCFRLNITKVNDKAVKTSPAILFESCRFESAVMNHATTLQANRHF